MAEAEKKPWNDNLWMDCLFELLADGQKKGLSEVVFADVDKLVIKKSHGITKYEMANRRQYA